MIQEKVNISWNELKFSYIKTDYRYISYFKDGFWDEGILSESNEIKINEGSTILHYGQGAFEGLKAFTQKDGEIAIFRPDMNCKRLNLSAKRLLMPEISEKKFLDALIKVIKSNYRWIPPYGVDASFYLRPYEIGIGENLGVRPSKEYLFSVFGVPVGPYFKDGFKPVSMMVSEYDRVAPKGTGNVKVGGNYASSLLPHEIAVKNGFSDCIYLDPIENKYIEEAGASNFFGITNDGKFITPKSNSILQSITRISLMQIAEDLLGLKVIETKIPIDSLDEFVEVGACGTAAVITPIGKILYGEKEFIFYDNGNSAGPITTKLYNTLLAIQRGEIEDKYNWCYKVK